MIHQANGSFQGKGLDTRAQCVCGKTFPVITTAQEMSLLEHIAKENEVQKKKREAAMPARQGPKLE